MIQLRSRERALLRQGRLFEPAASSGPAAMVLAISRNLSCIPRRSPCPGRYPLPLASAFLSTFRNLSSSPDSVPPATKKATIIKLPFIYSESLPRPISSPSWHPSTKKERHPTGSVLINITSRSPDVSGSYKTTHSPWP